MTISRDLFCVPVRCDARFPWQLKVEKLILNSDCTIIILIMQVKNTVKSVD